MLLLTITFNSYTKALDVIKKLHKDQNIAIKTYKLKLENLQTLKDAAYKVIARYMYIRQWYTVLFFMLPCCEIVNALVFGYYYAATGQYHSRQW